MKPTLNPSPDDPVPPPKSPPPWLASAWGRFLFLGLALLISVPASFTTAPQVGLDPSWQLSLQLAVLNGKNFGKDFVFTYGPLGYLLIHAAANKIVLLLYDLFVLSSLWSVYRSLWLLNPSWCGGLRLLLLAVVTKTCWVLCPAAILFTILCHWLWRIADRGDALAVAGALLAALVLFLGKVNYGLIMIFLIPAYGAGLWLFHPRRRAAGTALLTGFPLLVWLGAMIWHVDLPAYLRSGIELITGYNEAMFAYSNNALLGAGLAGVFLLAMGVIAVLDCRQREWREQILLLPLILLAAFLLFKNAFTRSDGGHEGSFFAALPLLLAVWCIGWRGAMGVRILLLISLIYPLAMLAMKPKTFGGTDLAGWMPVRYIQQLVAAPMREDAAYLEASLRSRYPEAVLPADIQSVIGRSTVDVMPWESSIAILNGLNYQPRPEPQSYSAYTPWLDDLNAQFAASAGAPDYMLFACAQSGSIDGRPVVWDESRTKMVLLENYVFQSEFKLPMRVLPYQNLDPARVFLLKRAPQTRRFIPIATNEVSLDLGQPLTLPNTTNLLYLTLDVKRTVWGKAAAAALSPGMLIACYQYEDGTPGYFRAVLPILKTGVLVNRRVESADETRNWLEAAAYRNMGVTTIDFKTHNAAEFQTPLKGFLVEYRLVENEPGN